MAGRGSWGGLLLGWVVAVVWLAGPGAALAHVGSRKSVDVVITDDGVSATVAVDALDASLAVGTPAEPSAAALAEHGAIVSAWLADGLTITRGDVRCDASASPPRLTPRSDGATQIALDIEARCPTRDGPLWLSDDTVFDDDPRHETFVTITDLDGATSAAVLRADDRRVRLTRPHDALAVAGTFVREGAIHLVTGYDHVLFVLSLVLAAGLWIRRRGRRYALRHVAGIVTAFTVGHSLSLVAAALQWIVVDVQLVEIAIAASIVVVAGLNVVRPRPDAAGPWLAGIFGLIHGFGFSSVLADVGLPAGHRLVALLSFNVGIELAQLAFVAVVLVAISGWARTAAYQRVAVRGGSLAIAACGLFWLVQRGVAG